MTARRIVPIAMAAALLCATVGAQENTSLPDAVDLAAVLRLTRDASPRFAIERQAISGAEADRISAGAYPNPTVNYGRFRPSGGQSTLFTGTRQEQATVELPLQIGGQRFARVERAEREIEAARARVASGTSSLAAEAGAAYVALLAAQEKAALLSGANEELARLRNIVAGRQAGGVASRYDLTRLDVELGGSRAKLEDAKADITDRSGSLAALLGLPGWRPRAAGALAPMAIEDNALASARSRAVNSPAAIAAQRDETVAQSGVEVARRDRVPTPSLNLGRAWTTEPFGAANFLGFSVEIPILDTRQGPLARAEADAITARLRRELTEAEVAANLDRLAGMITTRQAALASFEKEAASRLPALKQMAEDAYRLGKSSILELLDATRSRYDLQQTRIALVSSLYEAQLRFLAVSGELEKRAGVESGELTRAR